MENKKNSFAKKISKLDNGYIVEINHIYSKGRVYPLKSKIVLAVFWAEHKGHNLIQRVRAFPEIRGDKGRDHYVPYITEIIHKNTSTEELSKVCLEKLIDFTKKEKCKEHHFKKVEKSKRVHKRVQDYFYDDLYSFLQSPIFNSNNINFILDKYKK